MMVVTNIRCVYGEEPDHQRDEDQGEKDQPGDGHSHHLGETFFPAVIYALDQGKRNNPIVENILHSVSSVVVREEEESNGNCGASESYADEQVCFIIEKGNGEGYVASIKGIGCQKSRGELGH